MGRLSSEHSVRLRAGRETAALWRITRIAGARAQDLGELRADTADAAIKRCIHEFKIEPERQHRISAYRVA
jgi:hypothetical protein